VYLRSDFGKQWTKATATSVYAGCNIYYYIGPADGNTIVKMMATLPNASVKQSWVESTGFYDTGATVGALTFNVRVTCPNSSATSRAYYFDDISLVPA
jgi:hypothetical protein